MRSIRIAVAVVLLLAGTTTPIADAAEAVPLWAAPREGLPMAAGLDDVARGRPARIATPLPGGVAVEWSVTYEELGDGLRLTASDGPDQLVITVGSVATGLITHDGTEYLVSGSPDSVWVTETTGGSEPSLPTPDADRRLEQGWAADPDGSIDLLVLYTTDAAVEAGGSVAIEQEIGDFVAATQQYLDTSDTGASVSLVGVVPTDDVVTGDIVDALYELTYPKGTIGVFDAAKFDEAFCLRGEADADVVVLVTGDEGSGYAGVAWVLDGEPGDREYAFAVTKRLAGSLTFAHELGHLLGNGHDADNGGPGRTPYAQGYRVPGVARTIMAYPCSYPFGGPPLPECPRIGVFSNPDIEYGGYAMGDAATADASRSISEVWGALTGWGWNDPPDVSNLSFGSVGTAGGVYRVEATVVDTTSCSGSLVADPQDGSEPVVGPWTSTSVDSFDLWVDVAFEEPASIELEVCLVDVQGLDSCDVLPVDVCHGSGLFTDVPVSSPFDEDIGWLACASVAGGFEDGTYRPAADVARQAMSAFMYRLAGEPAFVPPAVPTFSDVPASHPFFAEIEWLAAEGISSGYADGTFRPGSEVSRMAMAAFMYRLAGEPVFSPPGSATFGDVPVAHPFFAEVEWLAEEGISTGYPNGTFRPGADVSRQAMAAFMRRLAPFIAV